MEGIVFRYRFFMARTPGTIPRAAPRTRPGDRRSRSLEGDGVWSWIHVDDAALVCNGFLSETAGRPVPGPGCSADQQSAEERPASPVISAPKVGSRSRFRPDQRRLTVFSDGREHPGPGKIAQSSAEELADRPIAVDKRSASVRSPIGLLPLAFSASSLSTIPGSFGR
jgi:hypothetical protein